MSLKDINEEYINQTKKLSDVSRQLAFAAGAIIWLFHKNDSIILSGALLYSLIFLILFFLCDLFQYIFAVWKLQNTIDKCQEGSKHQPGTDPSDIFCEKETKDLAWTIGALKAKVFFLVISYLILIGYYLLAVLDQHILSLLGSI